MSDKETLFSVETVKVLLLLGSIFALESTYEKVDVFLQGFNSQFNCFWLRKKEDVKFTRELYLVYMFSVASETFIMRNLLPSMCGVWNCTKTNKTLSLYDGPCKKKAKLPIAKWGNAKICILPFDLREPPEGTWWTFRKPRVNHTHANMKCQAFETERIQGSVARNEDKEWSHDIVVVFDPVARKWDSGADLRGYSEISAIKSQRGWRVKQFTRDVKGVGQYRHYK